MSVVGTFGPSSCRFFPVMKKLEDGGERDDRRLRKREVYEKCVVALRTKVTFRSSCVNFRASWEYINLRIFLTKSEKCRLERNWCFEMQGFVKDEVNRLYDLL
ncbi:hypothetical protein V1478_005428 [Vespula squamosa]|uniref:Uncharacterized protein n=1 Tax=Vespula squamosa TaxID=30214 RepID=A0ABD2BE69_VESSQ